MADCCPVIIPNGRVLLFTISVFGRRRTNGKLSILDTSAAKTRETDTERKT